jgi:hypothetical protein
MKGIAQTNDPRRDTKQPRNYTKKKDLFSCAFVRLGVISWIVSLFQVGIDLLMPLPKSNIPIQVGTHN